jgi:hypothetical protein
MKRQLKRTTNDTATTHESDGKFALKLNTQTAVQRDIRRQAERDARWAELVELYGDDACMYA